MANLNTYIAKGIDSKIKIIQDNLFKHLEFSNVDFYGRVQKSLNKDTKTIIPEVYISKNELKEVYYDDVNAPGGNVFFIEEDDKHTTKNGLVYSAKIKIVFMLNLDKLYPDSINRNDSEVQEYCVKLVRKLRVLEIDAVEKGLKNILRDFNIDNIKLHDMQPYHVFSINGAINYMYSCSSEECISSKPNTDPTPPPPPTCNVPVVSGIPNNQFIDQVLVSVGITKTWQLAGTYSPTSFDVTAGDLENWDINTETGLISYTPPESALNVVNTAMFKAINSCGTGSLLRFIKALDYNVSVLNAPINQSSYDINVYPGLPTRSFNYQNDVLAYDGTLTAYEVWVKGGIYTDWFLFANYTGSNMITNIGTIQTYIPCGQMPGTYKVKSRVKNSSGEYSAYTPELSVIVT